METAVPGAAAAAELFLAVTAPTGAAVRPLASAVVTAVVDDLGLDDAFVIAGLTAVAPGRGVSVLGIGIEGGHDTPVSGRKVIAGGHGPQHAPAQAAGA